MSQQQLPQSRMFRTIVLMGSSMALSCGGATTENGPTSSPAGAGAGAGGNVANAGSSAGSSGGGSPIGIGGKNGGGGFAGSGISTGGAGGTFSAIGGATSGGAGAGGAAGPTDCPPSQWSCADPPQCEHDTGNQPIGCTCDRTRPATPAACKAGSAFTCLRTTVIDGTPSGFECSCETGPDCNAQCSAAFGQIPGVYECDMGTLADTTLCGCSIIFLR
jgi:hypothetical protein